jgi:glycosyltransferase involved in cell wall biosynthesis
MNLKISIITACYNRAHLIETCIRSVLLQNYDNYEHIIIDAVSTDSTLELLKKYPHLKIISEPDNGLYDAWNKGLKLATGDIISIMNSDDFFGENIFCHINDIFQDQQKIQLITGKALQISHQEELDRWNVLYKYEETPNKILSLENLMILGPLINARFFRKTFLESVGFFDLNFRSASDIDFMIRVALKRPNSFYLDRYICYYLSHSSSLTMDINQSNIFNIYIEKIECLKNCILNYKMNKIEKNILREYYAFQCAIGSTYAFLKKKNIKKSFFFFCKGMRYPLLYCKSFLKDIIHGMVFRKKVRNINQEKYKDVLPAHLMTGIISYG